MTDFEIMIKALTKVSLDFKTPMHWTSKLEKCSYSLLRAIRRTRIYS